MLRQLHVRPVPALLLLLSYFLFRSALTSAQSNNATLTSAVTSVLMPSPGAASLGKFTDIPVSLYTGLPTISLPLWQLKRGDLTVDVALNYHGGGIKVDEVASWVGFGWSLEAGGRITRASRGLPDDIARFKQYNRLEIDRFVHGKMSRDERRIFLLRVSKGEYDAEPDLFTFSVGGISGRFVIGEGGTFLVMPRELNLRVEYDRTENGVHYAWIITDAQGIRYKFRSEDAERSTAIMYARTGSQPANDPTTFEGETSWCLTEMEDTKGNTFAFTYAGESANFTNINNESVSVPTSLHDQYCKGEITHSYTYSENLTTSLRLASIRNGQEEVRFVADAAARVDAPGSYGLQAVEVRYAGELKKRFRLQKSYMANSSVGTQGLLLLRTADYSRLRLDALQEEAATGVTLPAYQFTYDQTALPPRTSYAQDHWGYYNGVDNTSRVAYTVGRHRVGPNRDVNPAYARAGMLQAIRYPTGGSVTFTYEANRYVHTFGDLVEERDLAFITGNNNTTDNPYQVDFPFQTFFTVTPDMLNPATGTVTVRLDSRQEANGNPNPPYDGAQFILTILNADGSVPAHPSVAGKMQLGAGRYILYGEARSEFPNNPRLYFEAAVVAEVLLPNGTAERNGPGLRIKQITHQFATGTSETKTYEYVDPATGKSSAQLGNFPEYKTTRQVHSVESLGNGASVRYACTYEVFSAMSNYPLLNSKASYIGYSYVTEYSDADKQLGRKLYTYTNYADHNDLNSAPSFPFAPSSPQDWKRGKLRTEETQISQAEAAGQVFTPQQLTTSTYTIPSGSVQWTHGVKVGANTTYGYDVQEDLLIAALTIDAYLIGSDSHLLTEKVVTEYERGKAFTKRMGYHYTPDTFLPNAIATSNSDGSRTVQRSYYPTDYRAAANNSPLLAGLLAINRVGIPVEQTTRYERLAGSNRLTAGTVQVHAAQSGANGRERYYLQRLYALATEQADTAVRYDFQRVPGHYQEQATITHVTSRGEPVAYTVKGVSSSSVAYHWGYDERYPLAECKQATAGEFYYQGFEEETSASRGAGHTGQRYYSGSYTVQWVRPNSRTYVLSYWYRQGSGPWQYRTVPYTSNSHALSGGDAYDDIRIQPSDALMTTYTYEPLVGVTSQTDASGRTLYYEYDAFQRLLHIKDEQGRILTQQEYHYALQP